ncbi:MAG: L,D-transpeptidase [Anaerolineales bacterium]|nr:L,D-transpeptidase [Anaerolineales bacterium]
MPIHLSRRAFIKLGVLAAGSVAASKFARVHEVVDHFPAEQEEWLASTNLGRVAIKQVSLYSLPRDDARIIKQHFRDEVLNIYEELTPPTGPAWNPLWYRVWGGYVHSANIQKVALHHNPLMDIHSEGQVAEITVPYSQSFRFIRGQGWTRLYRLYYQTNHWITGVDEGPDGQPWYQLTDELGDTKFYVPAHHVRPIPDEELAPISPEVTNKWIEVNIAQQTLTAYEGDTQVFFTKVSTGVTRHVPEGELPTETPKGSFHINSKMPSKHMGEGRLTDNLEDYELVGVPWTAFFDARGYAIHGTYWHNNFGVTMSRGCVNLPNGPAKWLFRWMMPENPPTVVEQTGFGTPVEII